MNLLINGRWRLSLSELEKRTEEKDKDSFLYWINHSFGATQQHVAGQLKAVQKTKEICPDIKTVNEHFAGSGIGTMILQKLLNPDHHNAWDIDPICVENLQFNHPEVNISLGDARETTLETEPADFAVLDFNRFTATRINLWRKQLNTIFGNQPQAVYLCDTGLSRVPLLKQYYSEALGQVVTNRENYLNAYSTYFFNTYGYAMRFAAYSNFACMIFMPSDKDRRPELYKLNKDDGVVALQTW